METPILSKKQIKNSLSAKKNRPKETIKNVMKLPYSNNFWPEISIKDQEELENILTKNLPRYYVKKTNIPWRELKNIPKPERKEFRTKYNEDHNIPHEKIVKPVDVLIGINKVSKALESNSAQAILISSKVQPRLLVQHIIDLAVLYNVPILCLNNLCERMKSVTGIQTVCFGISKNNCNDSKYKLIVEKIESIFKKIPPPKSHINYGRSIDSFKIQKESKEIEEEKREKIEINEAEIRKSVYLKRPDDNSRAFVPVMEEKKKILAMDVDQTGFLAFTEELVEKINGDSKINISKKKTKSRAQYKALIVKRLKGDNNRNQRKIRRMKK
ncbi:ribonuclease P protein subunit p38-like [Diorhabda carinulata]|uniref:ribonuclease P protein subunit p38-like n=1 Tax=Diorhabda carinulata TaxID=1163345 RepID=UPI00259FF6A3|nr:ribonuclease P protein subunit p38-like [Diorhabda carinulata]